MVSAAFFITYLFLAGIIIWVMSSSFTRMKRKERSRARIVFWLNLIVVGYLILLLLLLYISDTAHADLEFAKYSLSDAIVYFALWYLYVPPLFLLLSAGYYLYHRIKYRNEMK